ncbi:MAG: hypothetical protein HZB46_17155, partial [Solirubrobacterales bacterium]|nr:hypothetical protein [Solirubrobacterales bacterium]
GATTPAPPDAPGPSVTAAGAGASEAEREEAATATAPDPEVLQRQAGGPVDQLVEEETSAAAAEAGAIGGRAGSRAAEDPAMEPVYEAGGGEAEGFEEAEAELIEAASHGDSRANPIEDAITPEVESDLSTAAYGEPDEEDVTEVTRDVDPATGKPREEDDPGEGPGIAADR